MGKSVLHLGYDHKDDVHSIEFKSGISGMADFITDMFEKGKTGKVFLVAEDDDNGDGFIYVTEYIEHIVNMLIFPGMPLYNHNEVHLHVYDSYQSAYNVALGMRERNPLCYNKNYGINET